MVSAPLCHELLVRLGGINPPLASPVPPRFTLSARAARPISSTPPARLSHPHPRAPPSLPAATRRHAGRPRLPTPPPALASATTRRPARPPAPPPPPAEARPLASARRQPPVAPCAPRPTLASPPPDAGCRPLPPPPPADAGRLASRVGSRPRAAPPAPSPPPRCAPPRPPSPLAPARLARRRHPKDILEMTKHLWWNGYMRDYDPPVDFSRHERDRGEVMRQRIDGNENDGILNLLDDLRDADMPELPWDEQSEPEEPPEPEGPPQPEELPEEEPEPTARAFIDMMASARRPLYPGAKMSQLDGITQLLADKCMFESTRASFEKTLNTVGNMLPEGHCLPKTMYHEVDVGNGQKRQTKVAIKILRYLPFIKRIQRLYMFEETAKQMTWHKTGIRLQDEKKRVPMVHPSDGQSWKRFDEKHPNEASEARNVRIAIATDGFNPYEIPKFNGATVDAELRALQPSKEPGHQFEGYGKTHNWTHIAGITELEYYKDLELPHNIDMMHTEKNCGEAFLNTCCNIPGKSRDNVSARVDIEEICDRVALHMQPPEGNRKGWLKPHAKYCLDSADKKEAFTWLKYDVMFPDGYCSNMSKGVNLATGKINGLKSHDYHIWIERLMPVMLRGYLPDHVWRVLAEVSHFFRTVCAKQICTEVIEKLQQQVPDMLCNQFHDEMWSGRNGPTPTQWYTLLKEGAPPLNKSFVNWFHEKGADPNVEMTDELRCVSQGFNRRVHTHEKYDVNGYRFHTEFHQKNRPNAKTINTGVYTRGADDLDYYGRLQKVYELTFNNANIELKLFVFKCHWFDPHGGMRSTPSIGLVEVRPTTTYSGSDVYVVAHQTKQVYYLSYPCQNEELMGWEVVFQVSPHGKLPIPSEDDYNNIDPVTYEGIFYQEEEQFGALQIDIGLQDLHNDVQMRGETVVDLKDIAMLTKRHANKDNIVETQPEPNADHEYSYDTDFDSEAENPMPRDESGDECGSQGRVLPDGVEDPLFPPGVTKTQTEDGEDEGEDELEDEGEDELEDEGGMHSSF
ncbi:hypothetical protein QYE76_008471 [Lolium multiflorum]|uniref:DUF4216 domain-containing protein n=1 Tax=Lolium multiflorum TaxID=4521 RepID=A0AAD8X2N8_LOLMU|nr:hypothetical protein QYE76_008471 [Lolium multiflorum]